MVFTVIIVPILIVVIAITAGIIISRRDRKKYEFNEEKKKEEVRKNQWWIASDEINKIKRDGEFMLTGLELGDEDDFHKKYYIDILFISYRDIYLIKVDNKEGEVFGSKEDPYWVRRVKGAEISFKNPLDESKENVELISRILKRKYDIKNVTIYLNADISRLLDSQDKSFTLQRFKEEHQAKSDYLNDLELQQIYNAIEDYREQN